MALPPTIPTSFVPKQPVSTTRAQKSGVNILMIIASVILGGSILMSAGVFGYEFYLTHVRDQRKAALEEAQSKVDLENVESFIRLKNRLEATGNLLDQHVLLSHFFDVLEAKTLQAVRFSSLSVDVHEDRSAELELSGVARTFNALAAQSAAIAAEKRIKRAIFSDIAVNTDNTVAFALTATVDERLLTSAEIVPGIPVQNATSSVPAPTQTAPVAPAASTTTKPASSTPSL